jgi:hypothetical protein
MTAQSDVKKKKLSSKKKSPIPQQKSSLRKAMRLILQGARPLKLAKIGKISLPPGSEEAQRCKDLQSILKDYASRTTTRPFSIAVFGPPGSGKSTYVPQIVEPIKKTLGEHLPINVSQLAGPADLFKVLYQALDDEKPRKVFFFDEFDATLDGISLGWLRWFLAPMQDGKFFFDGREKNIGKAVFIFAGGTAASLEEFEERARLDPIGYRDKKVPDFISRLRGFMNILGINEPVLDRPLRRALVLHVQLGKRWPEYRKSKKYPIEPGLLTSLLSNVHYIHGARSMEAMLEMSRLGKNKTLTKKGLPKPELKALHISRGRLQEIRIGISAGLDQKEEDFLISLSGKLFENGATLAYGGNLVKAGTLEKMVKAASEVPEDLIAPQEKQRIRNYLGYPAYKDPTVVTLQEKVKKLIKARRLKTLSKSECGDLSVPENAYFRARPEENKDNQNKDKKNKDEKYEPKKHLAWSLSLFRMRVHMIQEISAVVAFGGKDDGRSWGRFSGIAEEVMLALAMGKPVYLLGKPGGAAQAIGKLLGLDETMVNPDTCLADIGSIEHSPIYRHFKHAFVLPEQPDLPRTVPEVRSYLFEHGITSSAWPWNGLTPEENRKLFNAEITDPECVNLIIKGLTRLDWDVPRGAFQSKDGAAAERIKPVDLRSAPSTSRSRGV